ncbi:tyrosine-type recombinase/integrase [Metabacillus sp. Hm71]|uniref:tyrosine-type recombinase/integrase n=1 Tax=Metabacillus sp. Hm71 TaxID=3450743 RepID=UPI003F4445D3
MLANNIVKLNNTEVYDQILRYFKKIEDRTDKPEEEKEHHTKKSYMPKIEKFFSIVRPDCKGDLRFLTRKDVQITLEDFEDFIEEMRQSDTYVNKTINLYVTAARGLLDYLHSKKIVKDISYFSQIERLPESNKSHGVLSVEEALKMAELALEEREKGEIKRMLILFSIDTCIRKGALLKLKWSNFREENGVVIIEGVDKGNKEFRKTIAKWFYDEMVSVLKTDNSEYVFNINNKGIQGMMNRLKEKMNISEDRQIVFHSLRKTGASFTYRLQGNDIMAAKKALNHSNINSTMRYIGDRDHGACGAVSLGKDYDKDAYKKINHEELLKIIDEMPGDYKLYINMKIQELNQNVSK